MKKWYYDDPLAAAWMAKHFDMHFLGASKQPTGRRKYLDPIHFINGEWRRFNEYDGRSFRLIEDKFYISPESLCILNPLENDMVGFNWTEFLYETLAWVHEVKNDQCRVVCGPEGPDDILIPIKEILVIRRGNVAFHWPKEEA